MAKTIYIECAVVLCLDGGSGRCISRKQGVIMIASVILAHPFRGSFNHAIFSTVCRVCTRCGIIVHGHDLYKENFQPNMTADELGMEGSVAPYIHRYIQELIDSQYLFFIHPNWWGQPPAILKGYLDRVLRPPYTFDNPPGNGGGPPIGKLTGKYGIVFNTSNTGREREMKYFHDPLEHIWKYCVFSFCGITRYYRKNYAVVLNSTENERKLWLKEIETTVERIITE